MSNYNYKIKMQHDEDTFVALSHMQYDLFCRNNRIVRSALSLIFVLMGIWCGAHWWGILLIGYGCYLTTSTYSAPNHTAHKLADQIRKSGQPFPSSEYIFENDRMRIRLLPERQEMDPLFYSAVRRLGEDSRYFYLFKDQYGGFMIPKSALGSQCDAFRQFVSEKCGQEFRSRKIPLIRLMEKLTRRSS